MTRSRTFAPTMSRREPFRDENSRLVQIAVRMSEGLFYIVREYAQEKNMSMSAAISHLSMVGLATTKGTGE